MAVTIYDVAAEAEVSPATVSRYFTNKNVSEEKKQRIVKVIEKLGYESNFIASGLKSKKSMTIGVIVRNTYDIFESSILIEAEKVFKQHKYSMMLCSVNDQNSSINSKFKFLIDKAVDGILYFPTNNTEFDEINKCVNKSIPVVILDEDIKGANTDKIFVNNKRAIYDAVKKLYNYNHKKIAIINGPVDNNVSKWRYEGYKKALTELDLKLNDEYIEFTDYSVKQGYDAAVKILKNSNPPTAICVTNYFTSIGALKAINDLRIIVPQDLSVVAMDKFELTDLIADNLSVITQPIDEIGRLAANILLKRIENDYSDFPQTIELDTNFIDGKTIKKIK